MQPKQQRLIFVTSAGTYGIIVATLSSGTVQLLNFYQSGTPPVFLILNS